MLRACAPATRLSCGAKDKQFDVILTEAQDRLWRDQEEMHAALKRFRFWGVKVFVAATGTDLTDEGGGMLATVVGLKDEAFLQDLRRKTRRGMAGQVHRGFAAGGPPYGYRMSPVYDDSRRDAYGNPLRVGAKFTIHEPEAAVVRRIFEMYADGMSPKAIARRLTAERIPPPRGRVEDGWPPATIHGVRAKGTGILNNEVYRGVMLWGRTAKVRHPDTGRRIPRRRDRNEWFRKEVSELRIVSEELWNRARARQKEVTRLTGGGRYNPTRHLFSGLLKCPVCGSNYTMRDKTFYACARNRGRGTCANGHAARRAVLEERLLRAIEEQILSPENVAYLARKVSDALQRANSRGTSARRALETELREAEREAENIKQAVRHGKATATLLEMLEETEAKIQRLRADLSTEPRAKAAVRALPSLVEDYLRDLRSVLRRDTERARAMLARLLGEIVLRPDGQGLVAELRGNVVAAVGFETAGAGRGILELPPRRAKVA